MTKPWDCIPLGGIAPSCSLELPAEEAVVWNLSLEDIEGNTGRVLGRKTSRVRDLGSSKCVFDTRHVLYSKLRPYLNKVVVPDSLGVGTSELIPLMPNERLDRDFLAFYLRSKEFVDFANANTRGANLPRIAMAELWAHKVPVPPTVSEQRRIVARIRECLERVDEIEALRKQANREADSIEFACFHDVLLEGINKKGWPIRVLGDVAKCFHYGTSQKAHTEPMGHPVLRMGNIQSGFLNYSGLKYVHLSSSDLKRYRLHPGDILINRTNSLELVGKAATFDAREGEWVYASYLVRVAVDSTAVLPEFATAVINSRMGREYVLRTARRAIGMVNINAKEMAKFPLPLPHLDEQKEVIDQLRAARFLAQELRATMAESEVGFIRQAILRKAFLGEI